jgi:hypothetical protein
LTLWLSVVMTVAGLAMAIGLAFDGDRSGEPWHNVSFDSQPVADYGLASLWVSIVAVVALNVAVIVGLVERKRWGQFLAVVTLGGGVLQSVWALARGRVDFTAPLLLALAWALYNEREWFAEGRAAQGPQPSLGAS